MRRRGFNSFWLVLVVICALTIPISEVIPVLFIAWVGYKAGCWLKRRSQRYYNERRAFDEWYRNRGQQ